MAHPSLGSLCSFTLARRSGLCLNLAKSGPIFLHILGAFPLTLLFILLNKILSDHSTSPDMFQNNLLRIAS
jgi:hypothetical protein